MSNQGNFDDVGNFHENFGLDNVTWRGPGPREVSVDLMEFRVKFMREELQEFEEALLVDDKAKMFDALIDLVYVAMGTAQVLGFPWQEGWNAVQRANMLKERATKKTASARGGTFDVIKPAGWKPPNIELVLLLAGFNVEEKGEK